MLVERRRKLDQMEEKKQFQLISEINNSIDEINFELFENDWIMIGLVYGILTLHLSHLILNLILFCSFFIWIINYICEYQVINLYKPLKNR